MAWNHRVLAGGPDDRARRAVHDPPVSYVRAWWVALLVSAVAGVAFSQDRGTPEDPFVGVADADPLDLGRLVARLGDDAVLDRLSEDRPVEVRLAAARAAPMLTAPERALADLATAAAGRDEALAPVAARSALRIARGLRARDLAAREVLAGDLAPAAAALGTLAGDASARADVRRAAALVVDALAALHVPRENASP